MRTATVAPAPVGAPVETGDFTAHRFAFEPRSVLEPHEHDRPAVRIQLSGSHDGVFGGRRYTCHSGDVALLPPTVRHFEAMGERGGNAVVLMPRSDAASVAYEDATASFRVVRDVRARHAAWRLGLNWAAPDAAAPLAVEHHLEEVLSVVYGERDTAGDVRRKGGTATARLPAGVRRARALLDEATTDAPTLDQVAECAGLSRAQLARSFRKACGCSVGEYLRRNRLDRAALLLRDGALPLAGVALTCGFYDQSHFTNAFRNWFGCTPREFRQAQAGAVKPLADRTRKGGYSYPH